MIDQHGPAVTTPEAPGRKPLGPRPFWWGIAGITLAQLLLRGWAAAGGWFYWDDFWWHDIVADNSLLEATGLSLGGHYSPLTYIPYYLLTAAFPYEWAPRVVVMLVTLLGINAGVLAVVRRLWPTRGPQLAVYVLWAFSTLAAPSWLWYSQFSMIGALLLTSTWTLWAYLRALSSTQTRASALAVVLLVISLFTQERMLVMVALMTAFLFLICRPTMPSLSFGGRGRLWAGSLGAVIVWLIVYESLPRGQAAPAAGGDGVDLLVGMITKSGIPALFGGPWVLNDEPVLARSGAGWWPQAVAVGLLLALVVWSVRLRGDAWRAWTVLGVAVALDAALVVGVRGATMGDLALGEWRYFSDLAVLGPLLVVSAFVAPGTRPGFRAPTARALVVLTAAYMVSAMVTTVPLGLRWHQSQSRPYAQGVIDVLTRAEPVVLFDRALPESVVNPVLGVQRQASNVFSIVGTRAVFNQATTDPLWIADDATLVPGDLEPARVATGPGECPYPVVGVQTTWIALPGPTDVYDWGVRIDYNSPTDVRAGVGDGGRTQIVDLPVGRHSMFVPMPWVREQVGVFLTDPASSICITSVTAGRAHARV